MLCTDGQRDFVVLIGKFEVFTIIRDYYPSVGGFPAKRKHRKTVQSILLHTFIFQKGFDGDSHFLLSTAKTQVFGFWLAPWRGLPRVSSVLLPEDFFFGGQYDRAKASIASQLVLGNISYIFYSVNSSHVI